jgi:zinc transporter ZupT
MAEFSNYKIALSAIGPLILLAIVIAFLMGPGTNFLEFGLVLPEIHIEQISFVDNEIQVIVRNTGPIDVNIVVADVNDRIQPAAIEPDNHLTKFETALVRIPYDWNEGQPYNIGLTIDDGTRFEKSVDAASLKLEANTELIGYLGLIGFLIGIVPIMIGLLWFSFIQKLGSSKYQFFLAFTVGLLLFLAFDAIEEASEISQRHLSDIFNGQLLIMTVVILSFLILFSIGSSLVKKSQFSKISKPLAISLMIAVGIGFHNFGEGLAVGAAIAFGQVALSTFLIVGFAIHNTTEGFAIAAPMARTKAMVLRLVCLGLVAGTPAIFGTWIGGFSYSPFATVVFLSIGAGAIFQVVVSIIQYIREENENTLSNTSIILGIGLGLIVMYLTSILI